MPNSQLSRPTEDELHEVLESAIDLVNESQIQEIRNNRGLPYHMFRDIDTLEACDKKNREITESIYYEIVWETLCYAQDDLPESYKPPQEEICTQHPEALNERMLAFVVEHQDFKRDLYVKFCLKRNQNSDDQYIHIDCHAKP